MMPGEPVDLGIKGLSAAVKIGQGGFAVVYRAFQTAFDRLVAVKVFEEVSVDRATQELFERECRAIGRLSGSPNILTVHDAGITGHGRPYIVMAFMSKGSLQDRLDREGPSPWQEAVTTGAKLARALAVAHQAHVLHRDVKPDNVLVSGDDEPQLADFGIARLTDVTQMTQGGISFTPSHVAPEVLAGQVATPAVDVYSLASTLFALMAGRPAFTKDDDENVFAVMNRVATAPVPDLLTTHGVPEVVRTIIESAMAKDPTVRPSAKEFAAQLERAGSATEPSPSVSTLPPLPSSPRSPPASPSLSLHSVPSPSPSSVPPPLPPSRRRPTIAALIALSIVAVAAVAAAATLASRGGSATAGGGASTTATSRPPSVAASSPPTSVPSTNTVSPTSSSVTTPQSTLSTPVPGPSGVLYAITQSVVIHSGPNTESTDLGSIPAGVYLGVQCKAAGEVVTGIWGPDQWWDSVNFNGVRGYVTDEWVDTKTDEADPSKVPLC